MKLHLLLEPEVLAARPKSCEIIAEWGELCVIFGDNDSNRTGLHCFVEGPENDLKKWLHQFGNIPVGNGSPMTECFELRIIKKE